MKIYADPITVNCRKVLAGLDLMGAPYELHHVDYFKGEQKGDAYTAINPNQSIPAMVDGDLVLWESNAILQYAADKNGAARLAWPRNCSTSLAVMLSAMTGSPAAARRMADVRASASMFLSR